MLRLEITVNFETIFDLQAVRIKGGSKPNDVNTYRLQDGTLIKHRYGDGALKLANAMILNHKGYGKK